MLPVMPALADPDHSNPSPRRVQDCVVFVVGGGCYAEYSNLRVYAGRKAAAAPVSRRIIYGCSELLSPNNFLSQVKDIYRGNNHLLRS